MSEVGQTGKTRQRSNTRKREAILTPHEWLLAPRTSEPPFFSCHGLKKPSDQTSGSESSAFGLNRLPDTQDKFLVGHLPVLATC